VQQNRQVDSPELAASISLYRSRNFLGFHTNGRGDERNRPTEILRRRFFATSICVSFSEWRRRFQSFGVSTKRGGYTVSGLHYPALSSLFFESRFLQFHFCNVGANGLSSSMLIFIQIWRFCFRNNFRRCQSGPPTSFSLNKVSLPMSRLATNLKTCYRSIWKLGDQVCLLQNRPVIVAKLCAMAGFLARQSGLSRVESVAVVIHSQVFVPNSRLVAFSETARLIWSDAPSGNSALISTVILRAACGSLASKLMISSAT
jgi:hypothetical protein